MTKRYNADREIIEKSEATINRETALRWQARALAGYRRYAKTALDTDIIKAENFCDEALEHAARSGDFGRLVGKLQHKLDEARSQARGKAAVLRRRAVERLARAKSRQRSGARGKACPMSLREARLLYRRMSASEAPAQSRAH